MYICQITGETSKPGEPLNKLVVQKRVRTYRNWDREKEETWESQGWEIVREINASPEGIAIWNSMNPAEQELFLKKL